MILLTAIFMAIGLNLYFGYRTLNTAISYEEIYDTLYSDVFELNMITNDILLFPSKRAEAQWFKKYDVLIQTVSKFDKHLNDQAGLRKGVELNLIQIKTVFLMLVEPDHVVENETKTNSRHVLLSERISELSHQLMFKAMEIDSEAHLYLANIQRRTAITNGVLMLGVFVVLLLSFLKMNSHVRRSIVGIQDWIEALGQGDLTYKIEIDTNDEIAEFAESLNEMTDQLDDQIVARNKLEEEIIDHEQTAIKLRQAEKSLRHTFDISPGLICVADANLGKFIECNLAVTSILGISVEEFTSTPFIEFIHPDDRERTEEEVIAQLKGSPVANFENRYRCKDGSYKWLSWQATAADNNGIVHAVATDITQRRQIENQIRSSLKEKEILLKEIHHRVKNNMQVILSLLQLQSDRMSDGQARETLIESQNRIYAMAAAYDSLHKSENLASIDLSDYLTNICQSVFETYNYADGNIDLSIEIRPIQLDLEQSYPIGMIINELLSNALKYAFPENKRGTIEIMAERLESNICKIFVSDNGVGIQDSFNWNESDSLGLLIVKSLVEDQLNGSIKLDSTEGTRWEITFPSISSGTPVEHDHE